MKHLRKSILIFLLILCTAVNPAGAELIHASEGDQWHFGFAKRQILPNPDSDEPLYIAGYNSGLEISGVLDYCEARAAWIDTGSDGILLIGIDCIALDSGSVAKIREGLANIPGCAAINVYSTHTHAGADTLGLWGPVSINGKNGDYMDALISAAIEAGHEASSNRQPGTLHFGLTKTTMMYRDSRIPHVYDENLYQLRFDSANGNAGLRMLFFGAHAESLRGGNSRLSRDFPGMLCDQVSEATGDDAMFLPGAIGGLIMTREFASTTYQAERNMTITAERLVEYALSIDPESEQELSPRMQFSCEEFTVPLDNIAFLMYKFLGILNNNAIPAESATGYGVKSELCVLMLDDLALALIPGEIFPELVSGADYGDANPDGVNPPPLAEIAAGYGIGNLLIIGLANDELGYIVPPSDFLLNEKLPYLEKTMDRKGENHYEETNSVGPGCAAAIASAFESALQCLN